MGTIHIVKQGECLSTIARQYGFSSWKVLYEHPANAELARRRPSPNHLLPGDPVAIPEPLPKTYSRPTGAWHELQVTIEKPRIRIRLLDHDGQPLAGCNYQLEFGAEQRLGTTDGDGILDEPIRFDQRQAKLIVTSTVGGDEKTLCWDLQVGALDPSDAVSGAQGRLMNLGLYSGNVDGNYLTATRGSIGTFQRLKGLPVTEELDAATGEALAKHHDEGA